MKKVIFTLVVTISILSVNAQLVISPDTFTYSGYLVNQNDHEEVNGTIINSTSVPDTVCWYVRVLDHPTGWEMSVCDINNCYIIFNANSDTYTFAAQPGVSNLFYFGVTPYCTPGNAHVELVMWLKSDSAGSVIHPTFFAEYLGTCLTSVRETNTSKVTIYPTAFQTRLTIESADLTKVNSIKMYNAIGNLVKEVKPNNAATITLETAQLSSGVYIIRMETPTGIITRRVVKE